MVVFPSNLKSQTADASKLDKPRKKKNVHKEKKQVVIYRLVGAGTVEEKVYLSRSSRPVFGGRSLRTRTRTASRSSVPPREGARMWSDQIYTIRIK